MFNFKVERSKAKITKKKGINESVKRNKNEIKEMLKRKFLLKYFSCLL